MRRRQKTPKVDTKKHTKEEEDNELHLHQKEENNWTNGD